MLGLFLLSRFWLYVLIVGLAGAPIATLMVYHRLSTRIGGVLVSFIGLACSIIVFMFLTKPEPIVRYLQNVFNGPIDAILQMNDAVFAIFAFIEVVLISANVVCLMFAAVWKPSAKLTIELQPKHRR